MQLTRLVVGFINTNCYILDDGENAVVIDPGAGADEILKTLECKGVSLVYIFLTHAHFDHVLAVNELVKKTGAKVAVHKGEHYRLSDAEASGHTILKTRKYEPIVADTEFEDGAYIDVGDMHFEFISTPGHTEGSVCIICGDMMFSGDTLFFDDCGRCDLMGGDYRAMLSSLRRLYELHGDYDVFPGHGEKTTLSRERANNRYMTEAMQS